MCLFPVSWLSQLLFVRFRLTEVRTSATRMKKRMKCHRKRSLRWMLKSVQDPLPHLHYFCLTLLTRSVQQIGVFAYFCKRWILFSSSSSSSSFSVFSFFIGPYEFFSYIERKWLFSNVVIKLSFLFVFTVTPPNPAVSSGKRRRTVTLSAVAQSQTFQFESSHGEGADAGIAACTSQQAARFGEAVASELETRTVEPFVAS